MQYSIESIDGYNILHHVDGSCQSATRAEIEFWNEILRLRDALRKVAQSHAWALFGECRSFGDVQLLTPPEADALAKAVLTHNVHGRDGSEAE